MKRLSAMMEWIRPLGIVLMYWFAMRYGKDPVTFFHILGPAVVIIMCGTVAFESLVIGEAGSEKVGYKPDRAYQVQSGLNNLATGVAAALVLVLRWGVHAEAAVVSVMLLFFSFSAANHLLTAIRNRNFKRVNLMRPVLALFLLGLLLPPMLKALAGKGP